MAWQGRIKNENIDSLTPHTSRYVCAPARDGVGLSLFSFKVVQ